MGKINHVMIIGASGGIGQAVARSLMERENTHLYLLARSIDSLNTLTHDDCVKSCQFDMTDKSSRAHAIDWVKQLDSPLTHVINCAGTMEPITSIATMQEEAFSQHWMINAQGPLFFVRDLMPFIAPGSARILWISSGVVNHRDKGTAAYTISKIATEVMADLLRAEYADQAKFSCIRPGIVDTAMTDLMLNTPADVCPFVEILTSLYKTKESIYSPETMGKIITNLLMDVPDQAFEKTWDLDNAQDQSTLLEIDH